MTANGKVISSLINTGWQFDAATAAACMEWLRYETGMQADYLCTRNQVHLLAIDGAGGPALCGVTCDPTGWRRSVIGLRWYVPPLGIDPGTAEGMIHQEMVRFLLAVSAHRFLDVSAALPRADTSTATSTVTIRDI